MMPLIVRIFGEEKTGKTTVSLSFPRPLYHMDIDVGGYRRAIWRFNGEGIISESFPQPIQLEKMAGAVKDGITIKFPKKVVGIKELWQRIVSAYVAKIQDNSIKTIVIDSGTALWAICHMGYLQEKQEIQIANKPGITENELREKLQPIEYAQPNSRIESIIDTARSYGKNLILTHYPRDVYASRINQNGVLEEYRTGDTEPDGYKGTGKKLDLSLCTKMSTTPPIHTIATVDLSGLGTALLGATIDPPPPDFNHYNMLEKMIKMSRGENI